MSEFVSGTVTMLIVVAGLPGTGKSALAEAIARRTGGAVINKDRIRAALFAPEDIEYSAGQDDFCMELMLQTARYLFVDTPARRVLLDGRTFSRAYQRDRATGYADALGQSWRILECVCAESTARDRIARDIVVGSHPAANRTQELYTSVRLSWEAIGQPRAVIDTDQPLETCVDQAIEHIAYFPQ